MLVLLGNSQNMKRTAEGMYMSQPAASRMLQEIEDMFDCRLFERLPHGMLPTPLGMELVKFATRSLHHLEGCMETLALQKKEGFGYLSVGAIMGAAPEQIMAAISRLKQERPRLCIRVMGDTSDEVVRLLEQGRIDLAIARRSPETEDAAFNFRPLGNEILRLAVAKNHILLQQQHIELPVLLRDWPWILQAPSSPARMALEQYLLQAALPLPGNIIESNSVYSMLQLIQRTNAVMLLAESAMKDYLDMGIVQILPIKVNIPLPPFGILTRKHEALSEEQQIFISCLDQSCTMAR
ncbi:LysR family transcriptional regulator [Aquitalea sp. LB_tupeE]|uniref:LysR family transcriptional regulator n=1 Tax=Aquitalea sp. LB_tupeE TaxID=2748078 RepID=UPI001C4B1D25|nr:LysR family transcriptional regulator [Aquitalea sp. LB_tupeE]